MAIKFIKVVLTDHFGTFSSKNLTPRNIVPNLMFPVWNFIAIFKLNMVKLALRNLNLPEELKSDAEIEDLSKFVLKTQDQTSLNLILTIKL